jgi:opacity protein-like surface antigen
VYQGKISNFSIIVLLPILIYTFITPVNGQRQFNARASFGGNISQIDGDKLAGFDKFGLTGGIGLSYKIYKQSDLSLEFLYSRRGAASSLLFDKNSDIGITLNYVDIPVLFTINDWIDEEKAFFKVFARTGIQYSRLINSSTNFNRFLLPVETISNFDLSYLIGFGYNLTKNIGIEARYSRSLMRIQKELIEDIGNFKIYYWTFRMNYYL